MVVDVAVGDGDPVRAVGDIDEAIVGVLAVVERRGEVAVVDPDVLGVLDTDGVAVGVLDLLDLHVADDDVLLVLDVEANAAKLGTRGTDDGLVGGHADLVAAGDGAPDNDVALAAGFGSLGELGQGRDGSGRAALSAGGTPIGRGVANVARVGNRGTLLKGEGLILVDGRGGDSSHKAHKGEVEDVGELHDEGADWFVLERKIFWAVVVKCGCMKSTTEASP